MHFICTPALEPNRVPARKLIGIAGVHASSLEIPGFQGAKMIENQDQKGNDIKRYIYKRII